MRKFQTRPRYTCEIKENLAHAAIARSCMLTIPLFGEAFKTLVSRNFDESSPLLLYSCLYWSAHIEAADIEQIELRNAVLSFLGSSQILSWVFTMMSTGNHHSLVHALEYSWISRYTITQLRSLVRIPDTHERASEWASELCLLMREPFGMVENYQGETKDGRRHGLGTCVYEVGDNYEGYFEEGRRHGYGVMRFANGNRFEGTWKHDKQQGKGVWTFSDGVSYEGEWIENVPQPGGIWTFTDGTTRQHIVTIEKVIDDSLPDLSRTSYIGVCTVPKYDAVGRFVKDGDVTSWIEPNGAQYIGGFMDGKKQGYGIWKCGCTSEYRGYWKDDMEHGDGVWFFRNGNRYTGEWKEAWENGFGVLLFHDGQQYSGHWKNGKAHGTGEMTFKNGNRYTGVWFDGQLQGKAEIEFGKDWMDRVA